jgi:hypothetical protein
VGRRVDARFRSNCSTIVVAPRRLVEVISVTPAMRPNWRSSGVATAAAIVSGLAPGKAAWTWMTGNSTWGSGATGSNRYATAPTRSKATLRSDVAMGRRMKGSEMLMSSRGRHLVRGVGGDRAAAGNRRRRLESQSKAR